MISRKDNNGTITIDIQGSIEGGITSRCRYTRSLVRHRIRVVLLISHTVELVKQRLFRIVGVATKVDTTIVDKPRRLASSARTRKEPKLTRTWALDVRQAVEVLSTVVASSSGTGIE